jgi:hypothetical protein
MRIMMKAGKVWLGTMLGLAAFGGTAQAGGQELSDKSVTVLMEYAWSLVPAQFSQPDGKVIVTDKKKKEDSVVPMEVAKEVIKVARMSAHAQECDLKDEQSANHKELMKRQKTAHKWSPQQMLYINQLHLVTVMLLTGKAKVTEKDGNKEVSIAAPEAGTTSTCSPEEKAKVKAVIDAYVASAAPADPGPAAAPVAAAAASAPAEEKK